MGAWICPTCRLHYGEEARQRCPADGATLVLNLSGASVQGHLLTHLLHVKPDGTTVWEAHAGPDERVALELLRGPQSAEAWAWAKGLDHPHIASVKGFAPIDDDLACAVMAWIDGEPLSERLAQGPMPVPTALHLADQILDALSYVHQQDGVHGDLQPSTIFLEKGTDAKLINVGVHRWPPLAEVLGSGGAQALDLSMVAYAAPERLAQGAAEPAGDLYSLCALLWHLVTGAPIFGSDPHACARAHLTAPRPDLSATFPDRDWPEGLAAFLARGLAQRPEGRFASAEAMRTALRPIREATQRVPAAPKTTTPPAVIVPLLVEPPSASAAPPNQTWLWIAGVGVLLIGGVLIGNALRDDPTTPDALPARAALSSTASSPASDPVERVRATPLSAAPRSTSVAMPASIAAPESIALTAPESAAPESAAPESAAPESAAPMSIAAPASMAPSTASPAQIASATAPISAAPVSVAIAPASEMNPVQVASEPAPPIARPAIAKARRTTDAAAKPKAVARKADRVARKADRVARSTPRRRKPVRKVSRKKDRPVARAEDRETPPAPLTTLGETPKLPPSVSKHGIRILGQ